MAASFQLDFLPKRFWEVEKWPREESHHESSKRYSNCNGVHSNGLPSSKTRCRGTGERRGQNEAEYSEDSIWQNQGRRRGGSLHAHERQRHEGEDYDLW